MTVHSDATATDGLLDFYSLEVDHWWRLLALLPRLRRGTQGDVTKKLTIRTRQARSVNLDGEIKEQSPVEFSINFGPHRSMSLLAEMASLTLVGHPPEIVQLSF